MDENIFYESGTQINELYEKYFMEFSNSTMIINVILRSITMVISDYNKIHNENISFDNEDLLKWVSLKEKYTNIQEDSYNNLVELYNEYEPSILFKELIKILLDLNDKNNTEIDKINELYSESIILENTYFDNFTGY